MSVLLTLFVLALVTWFVFWAVDASGMPAVPGWIIKAGVALLVIIKALALINIGL